MKPELYDTCHDLTGETAVLAAEIILERDA